MTLYSGKYSVGAGVRVRDEGALRAFQSEWKWHHPVSDAMIEFAGVEAIIASVGYYHGGDVLYTLSDIPGVWHERCLESDESKAGH